MDINIENCQDIFEIDAHEFIDNVVRHVLKFEEVDIECELNVFLVDNKKIREINLEYRGIDRSTDCLSFPMLNYKKGNVFKDQYKNYEFKNYELDDGKLILGDIIISLEKANEQSIEFNHSFERETKYLLIHSLLHLLGYDHIEDSEKQIMRVREKSIIKYLKIFR